MLFIKNGHIKTMAGQEYANGYVLIGDDGKIVAVGENLEAPAGAAVVDAQGRLVTPGPLPHWPGQRRDRLGGPGLQ